MLEEEMKVGEQEREALRIETQRLRDELSDLRVEYDIVQDKLRHAENVIERQHEQRKPSQLTTEELRPRSPVSEISTSATTLPSPTASTPPLIAGSQNSAVTATPPSPPLSETSLNPRTKPKPAPLTPVPTKKRAVVPQSQKPRPSTSQSTARTPRHSRGPSILSQSVAASPAQPNGRRAPSVSTKKPAPRISNIGLPPTQTTGSLTRSGSLYQMRNLRTKMQKLEERVHTVRSKLPAPTTTPPRASPRSASTLLSKDAVSSIGGTPYNNVTLRSGRKQPGISTTSSGPLGPRALPVKEEASDRGGRVSRLSFGLPSRPGSVAGSRPDSNNPIAPFARPESRSALGRPSSRLSMSRPVSRTDGVIPPRTPSSLEHYHSASLSVSERRPRSRISGNFGPGSAAHTRGYSISSRSQSRCESRQGPDNEENEDLDQATPLARRTTGGRPDMSAIPARSGLPKRQSAGRRQSRSDETGDMPPPSRRVQAMSDVGETF